MIRSVVWVVGGLTAAGAFGCGGSSANSVDEERVAERAAEIVIERMRSAETDGEETRIEEGQAVALRGQGAAGEVVEALADDDPARRPERYRVSRNGAPVLGAADPLVTIVTFSDFECPFCARVQPTLERILQTYPNDVRLVFRHNPLPFHRNAPQAHQLAIEAYEQQGDAGFWRIHDVLFQNTRALQRADLERYAAAEGLDMRRVRRALDSRAHQAVLDRDQATTQQLNARGTPAFFINGRKLMGAQPFEAFDAIIQEELAHGRRLVQNGTPRQAVYDRLGQHALARAPTPAPSAAAAPRPQPDPDAVYHVPVGNSPVRGPANALVTIVVFSDFECPFCARLTPTLEQIENQYGQDVRLVFKHNPLPFHRQAMGAAEAAMEVRAQRGDQRFWEMHDRLFRNQDKLEPAQLEQMAQRLGANLTRYRRAIQNQTHRPAIEADQALARGIGATGTPSTFINGRNLRGAQPLQSFTAVIDEELRKARELVRQGIARRGLYAHIIRNGARSPQTIGGAANPSGAAPTPNPRYQIAVPNDAPSAGPSQAPVTIQIFSDFQCPFCSRALPTVEQVRRRFPRDVRVVFRHYPLPFHREAPLAAEASIEVQRQLGDRMFWRFHDTLFSNQRALTRADLEQHASRLSGLDMAAFRRALDNRTHQARVQEDMDAVRDAGARIGTPSFLIGDRLIQGAQPFPVFEQAIQEALGNP
ncbi:MAG: thioredoxin domain-containing protein [Myxococcota bacterium]